MKTIKKEQLFTNKTYLINYETIEKIKKQLLNLKAKKIKLIEKSEKIEKKLIIIKKLFNFELNKIKK